MICKKCGKENPDNAPFCCWCGKKQSAEQKKTRRRARGSGTISKDSRYKNPWRAIAPPVIKGKSGKCIGYYATAKEAQQALDTYMNEKRPDLYNATLGKIYELWSANHYETVSDGTVYVYRAAYKSIIELSRYRFRELKTADFQRVIDAKAAEGASPQKLESIKVLCGLLCKYAMQNDIIGKNYASFIKLPKKEKKEKQIFTAHDLDVLWSHTDDKRVQVILTMCYTGFRIGEIAALTPADIHDTYMVGGEKTEAGKNRIVPFPPNVPEIEQFVRSWIPDCKDTLIGLPAPRFRNERFYPCLAELGLIDPPELRPCKDHGKDSMREVYVNPRLTPHSTRHTFASLSVAAGMPPETLRKIIGHAAYSTTAEIYVHKNLDDLSSGMSLIKR